MSDPIDRELIARLLQDESLSYREIARRSGASDWSVRAVARELAGDERPMKDGACSKSSEPFGFVAVIGVIVCCIAGLCFFTRGSWLPENELDK